MKKTMKKLSLISIGVIVFFCQLKAGDHSLYFGINTSTFADTDAKPLMGMSLGYSHQWHICKTFAILAGFEYMTRGARLEKKQFSRLVQTSILLILMSESAI
jgi:hypothetical protein